MNRIINIDVLEGLKSLSDCSVQCCVTSPPYFGLRDYGHKGQLGLEDTPEEYIEKMVQVFEEVRRVLKKDGTLWLNIGDSYAGGGGGSGHNAETKNLGRNTSSYGSVKSNGKTYGLKKKDLIGIPWMLAFALRSHGWYLRQDIIWNKPNPMPESVTDRCTKSHEYIFLMTKKEKYYYNAEAIKTKIKDASIERMGRGISDNHKNINGAPGQPPHSIMQPRKNYRHRGDGDKGLTDHKGNFDKHGNLIGNGMANKKSVWTVTTMPYKDAHFATFPEILIVDCIKAGSKEGDLILDPFMGAGTTALVASKLGRSYIGFELSEKYVKIANKRLRKELGMFMPD